MERKFKITSEFFTLVEAFKKEAEKIGWTYRESFTTFSETKFTEYSDLYFDTHWDDKTKLDFQMALTYATNSTNYKLPEQWNEAIKAIQITKQIEVTIQEIANWKGVDVDLIRIKKD